MVRTKADSCPAGRKVVGGQTSKKIKDSSSSSGSRKSGGSSDKSGKRKSGGGNQVRMRATPDWQKSIGHFFKKPRPEGSEEEAEEEEKRQDSSETPDSQTSDSSQGTPSSRSSSQ